MLCSSLLLFTSRAFLASLCSREQQLAYVEAENSVLLRWVPGADGASGATGYRRVDTGPRGGRFCSWGRESEQRKGGVRMRRVLIVLSLALVMALVMALTVGTGVAKQATSFEKGQTTTHKGNSTNSQVDSCFQGKGSQNPC